jgi:hypothetical protein
LSLGNKNIIKNERQLNPYKNVNATRIYAKLDFEPWYNVLNVNMEAVNSITDSARREKEMPG